MYSVSHDGRNEIVYVAGPIADRWVFWKGHVFHGDFRGGERRRTRVDPGTQEAPRARTAPLAPRRTSLTAPMPARVIRIAARAGVEVKKGETLIVLEAMKMELPIRAPEDGKVTAVHCREGELVQSDTMLIELE